MKQRPPDHPWVWLTQRQFEVLKQMQDEDEELVCEGRDAYVNLTRTSMKVVNALLFYVLISGWDSKLGASKYQTLHINEVGQAYLRGERDIYPVSDGHMGTKMVVNPFLRKK
jgi:hypothetical protein